MAGALATATTRVQGRRPTELTPGPPELTFPLPEPTSPLAGATATADPYPIARATIVDEAAECMLRALRAENIPVADITDITHTPWGWQATVRVSKGTPAAIIEPAPDLETLFDLGKGDVIVQPLKNRTACAVLMLRQGDMFADLPPAPYLAPKSISITQPACFGGSANGDPLAFALAGLMGEVIARSGGGKSTLLRAFVDVTTACFDAVTLFLDPSGDGPAPTKTPSASPASTLPPSNESCSGSTASPPAAPASAAAWAWATPGNPHPNTQRSLFSSTNSPNSPSFPNSSSPR